ncbi:uncharacterized protein LOC121376965 [Gigantopelta aegis]|uniref:uncharacterized protein LOC121376965 n=1 Tax=Gigantopelta aegis TaxID=1735272 RepID=UPI001B88D3D4|nr:uncharacterized protein LOC121376965 [Gigantopelta aegis]
MDTRTLCFTAIGVLVAILGGVSCEQVQYCGNFTNTACCLRNDSNVCPEGYVRQADDNATCFDLTTVAATTLTQPTTTPPSTPSSNSTNTTSTSGRRRRGVAIEGDMEDNVRLLNHRVRRESNSTNTSSANSITATSTAATTSTSTAATTPETTSKQQQTICVLKCYSEYSVYKGICRKGCPSGFEPDSNNVCKEKTTSSTLYYIIGGAVGGGVLLIVVGVVVAVCLCRRKRNRKKQIRRPMSELLQQREMSNTDVIDLESSPDIHKGSDKSPYANIAYTEGLQQGIEQQHDKVFRYIKDPTCNFEEAKKGPDYENKAVVDWNQLHKEKEELDTLPPAPPPPPTKVNEDQYLRMEYQESQHEIQGEWNPEENYENFNVTDADAAADEEPEQELYENRDIAQEYMRKASIAPKKTEDEDSEQEDYENTQVFKNQAAKAVTSPTKTEDEGEEFEQEDYENTKDFKQKPVKPVDSRSPGSGQEEAGEDSAYANFQFFNR